MDADVRTLKTDEDIADFLYCMRTAFLSGMAVTPEQLEWIRPRWDLDRAWGAFEDGRLCGTTRTFPTTLRLPGGAAVPVSALTQVTVLPTHTRRGHLTRMMRAQLDKAIDDGEAASILIAAEWPIYGRFGYGVATEAARWAVDTTRARVVGKPVGSCALVSREQLRSLAPAPFDANHAVTPGAISRDDKWWDLILEMSPRPGSTPSEKRVFVVHRDVDGDVDGFLIYDPTERWTDGFPQGTIEIQSLIGATPVAERELWRFVCELDLVSEAVWPGGSLSTPLPFLLADGRHARQLGRNDFVWARLLDVPASLTARSYAVTGSVVLKVVDPFLGVGSGRFLLDVSPDGAECTETKKKADVTVSVSALGAAWLGGTPLTSFAATDAVKEHTDGALARAGAILSWPIAPYCATDF